MTEATIHYVKFGGSVGTLTGERISLGVGIRRRRENNWLFHFAFGYASGFPVSAILYFLLTRHTLPIMQHWAWTREREGFEASSGQRWPMCVPDCDRCRRRLAKR